MVTRRSLLKFSAAGTAAAFMPVLARAQDLRPVLRVGVQALPPNLEPLLTHNNIGLRATDLMFDRPLARDFRAEDRSPGSRVLVPQLATSVTRVSTMVWEMKLRPNVIMHDGNVMSSADFLATFDPSRIGASGPYPEGRILFGHVKEVRAIDDLTVQIETKAPDPIMDQRLAAYGSWIVSAKALKAAGPDGFAKKPIGAGPYKLREVVRDARLVFDSHDEYWMGRPAARQITLNAVPEASTRVAGLISGEYDIVTNLLPDQIPQFESYKDLEVVSRPMDLVHLWMYDTHRPVMADVRMRKALSYGIDYDMLGHSVWGKNFNRPNGLQTPSFGDLYDPNRKFFNYDPDKARSLLKEMGYSGQELIMRLFSGYYVGGDDAAQIIQAMYADLGIKMRIDVAENAKQTIAPGADIRLISAAFRFPDPLGGGVIVAFGQDSLSQTEGWWKPTNGYNETAAELLLADDANDRRKLFHKMLDLFDEDVPATILYAANEIYAKRKSVKWEHAPLYYMNMRPDSFSFSE